MEVQEEIKINIFVPGRLCLFGEHSDWAGMHKVMNAQIVPGRAIVTGIEQGIYANVSKCDKFIVENNVEGQEGMNFECDMDSYKLKKKAQEGGYFSYVAGVASYIKDWYRVDGVRIQIYNVTLPIKSGLSSSAAICVLVARAFNRLYNLNLSTKGEMNIAFLGEQRTPSRCGRLDQACAYGSNPISMTFDGNEIEVERLVIGNEFHWVFADLMKKKDTIKILADLSKCYPFAQNTLEEGVQEALGRKNEWIVNQAIEKLKVGDRKGLGELMLHAQQIFDDKVAPACLQELRAPVLHYTLMDEKIKEFVFGGKGVGSQGDGAVQFLAKDEESQEKLYNYLKSELGMNAYKLTLKPRRKVRKAIIPVAGFGTRLYPATRGIKKELFPILDKDGMVKPVIMILLEQLYNSGIEEICLVIGKEEESFYNQYFKKPINQEHYNKLSRDMQEYEKKIQKIGHQVSFSVQKERMGFGHAVYQCRTFAENEPVLLLLGDMIYESYTSETCSMQVIDVYEKTGLPVVAIHEVSLDEVVHYGIVNGKWEDKERKILKLSSFIEKPTCEYAKDYLKVEKVKNEEAYYAIFGQYILTPNVFETLEQNIQNKKFTKGEIQLTDALEDVRRNNGMLGIIPEGRAFDVGIPHAYRDTVGRFGML